MRSHGHDFGSYGKALAAMRSIRPDTAAQALQVGVHAASLTDWVQGQGLG